MSFSPGHVVMLLLVIALVVPALIQVCGAPRPPSCARSTPPQWAARARPIVVVPSARRP